MGTTNSQGLIAFYNQNGDFKSDVVYGADLYESISLNAVNTTYNPEWDWNNYSTPEIDDINKNKRIYYAVGSAYDAGTFYPLAVYFSISLEGQLDKRLPSYGICLNCIEDFSSGDTWILFDEYPNKSFYDIFRTSSFDATCTGIDVTCGYTDCTGYGTKSAFAIMGHLNSEGQKDYVSVIRLNDRAGGTDHIVNTCENNIYNYTLEVSLTTDWVTDIKAASSLYKTTTDVFHGNLVYDYSSNKIYVVGDIETETGKADSDGFYWRSALVACVDAEGNKLWQKTHTLSEYTDDIRGAYLDENNDLYIAGIYSRLGLGENYFGYGFMGKVNTSNGDLETIKYFGENTYQSGFNSLVIDVSRAYAVGWTERETDATGFKAWFTEIDKNGL